MSDRASRLEEIQRRINSACLRAGRSEADVKLIAVSKKNSTGAIQDLIDCGQSIFGESRLQEAVEKVVQLPEDLEWHFIGRVQRNKVRKILPLFPVIHAIDSLRLAEYADSVAKDLQLQPQVFLQVNLEAEESKGGFSKQEIMSEIVKITQLENLKVIGLMAIPPATEQPEEARQYFKELRELRDQLAVSLKLPYLSMGMSNDFEIAIEEGATHVRVGSAIFGVRDGKVPGELG